MTMLVDVKALMKVPGSSENVHVTGMPDALTAKYHDYTFQDPLVFDGKVQSTRDGTLMVRGTLTFTVDTHCARCLKDVSETIHVPVEESMTNEKDELAPDVIYPYGDDDDAAAADDEDEDDDYTFDGVTADLSEMMKDQAILALPGRLFCEPDCPGLCPVCGRRKDDPACQCEEEEQTDDDEDSPFAVLKDWL